MNLKEAIGSLHQEHPEDTVKPLYTPWGENLDRDRVWPEYPRPQLVREQFETLNGEWDYCIVPLEDTSVVPGKRLPRPGKILVPFSPEALLSGVGRQLKPEEYLWYQRSLSFSQMEHARKKQLGRRCLLHFDAVDQQAVVYLDGRRIASHLGGYLPFTVDITDYLSNRPSLLQVRVRDESDSSHHTRGKQTLNRGGMFYTAQSGIWQSVWYEWVPQNYIEDFRITPDYDSGSVEIRLVSKKAFQNLSFQPQDRDFPFEIQIHKGEGNPAQDATPPDVPHQDSPRVYTTLRVRFSDGSFRPWSPEDPYLYPFTLTADEDRVESYFAMRSYTVERDERDIPRFCLNHKPYFLHGLLDQGYWSDGLMTAPCDEAFIFDIELAKRHGFNMLRKHIKIEPLRWYHHCDRLGMIVWQDMVSGGTNYHMPLVCYLPTLFPHISRHTKDHHYRLFSRADEEGRQSWEQECRDTIRHLYSVPSLAVWVPFNEGWGQFDAARIAGMVREQDPTRPIDHASGWFDQRGGGFPQHSQLFSPPAGKARRNSGLCHLGVRRLRMPYPGACRSGQSLRLPEVRLPR